MKRHALNISCSKILNDQRIPGIYTCDGKNINPPLKTGNLPKKTKSIAVIMEDKEMSAAGSVHWLAYNIPATGMINENEQNCLYGLNDFNQKCYTGPCPDHGLHKYLFRVYALDDFLYFYHENVSRLDVEEGIRYHIVGYGELIGYYKRSKQFNLVKIAG
ncbi:YbhB/YbcL family Raf kinase inhibitor-like protein [Echinicola marina]|uniref:YbhB/YbcL family Raf kinase inhibitor-like protein n=1 Tax=Echinicola marina TaxID=2859768 RepID=UPI001CF62BE5|nr:YbhB/YbcL family Raf kinase inhibitor-like protein [Echinicola marina]UCS92044.1 YbhB/YbcL family Raf kinase inhibitor-like protein [Echinicola marina]